MTKEEILLETAKRNLLVMQKKEGEQATGMCFLLMINSKKKDPRIQGSFKE